MVGETLHFYIPPLNERVFSSLCEAGSAITQTSRYLSVRVVSVEQQKLTVTQEFLGSPGDRTRRFHCRGPGFDPCWETKIPQAL